MVTIQFPVPNPLVQAQNFSDSVHLKKMLLESVGVHSKISHTNVMSVHEIYFLQFSLVFGHIPWIIN